MRFCGVRGQSVVGLGNMRRGWLVYTGERPDLILPLPDAITSLKIVGVRFESGMARLDLGDGVVWATRAYPANAVCVGDVVIPLDPAHAARVARPVQVGEINPEETIRTLQGDIVLWRGVWLMSRHRSELVGSVYTFGVLPRLGVDNDALGRIADALVAVRPSGLVVLPAGRLALQTISLEQPSFPLSAKGLEAEIRAVARRWRSVLKRFNPKDFERLRLLRRAWHLLRAAGERGLKPRRWTRMGSALGLVTDTALLAVGLSVKWNLTLSEEKR